MPHLRYFSILSITVFLWGWPSFVAEAASQKSTESRVFYVAQTSQARDSNTGTFQFPLRTVSEAIRRLQPGDTISIGNGDYRNEDMGWGRGVFVLQDFGDPELRTQILASNNASPALGSILLRNVDNLVVKGFRFHGKSFQQFVDWQPMPAVMRDEYSPQRPDYSLSFNTRSDQIQREFKSFFRLMNELNFSSGIELEDCENIFVMENRLNGYWAGIQCRHCKQISIINNEIYETVNGIFAWAPAPGLVDSYITNNLIAQTLDQGINIRQGSSFVRIVNNRIFYTGRNHIALQEGTNNCLVLGNLGWHGGFYSESMEFPGSSGISIHSSLADNWVVCNRIGKQIDVTGIDGNGLILDLMEQESSVGVIMNSFSENEGSGINTTKSPNAFIWGNFIGFNRYGIKLSRNEDINQTITGNIFAFNLEAAIKTYRNIGNQKSIDANTYYNEKSIIWDDDDPELGRFGALSVLKNSTPWESNGAQYPPK
ncbi:MAG: right-handed parallel beta-helix repeat-containing protein [Planctomycetota bacterium]